MKTTSTNSERLGFKTYFGTTVMEATQGITAALMASFFMVFLTDYSGIGKFAAVIGSYVSTLAGYLYYRFRDERRNI